MDGVYITIRSMVRGARSNVKSLTLKPELANDMLRLWARIHNAHAFSNRRAQLSALGVPITGTRLLGPDSFAWYPINVFCPPNPRSPQRPWIRCFPLPRMYFCHRGPLLNKTNYRLTLVQVVLSKYTHCKMMEWARHSASQLLISRKLESQSIFMSIACGEPRCMIFVMNKYV